MRQFYYIHDKILCVVYRVDKVNIILGTVAFFPFSPMHSMTQQHNKLNCHNAVQSQQTQLCVNGAIIAFNSVVIRELSSMFTEWLLI